MNTTAPFPLLLALLPGVGAGRYWAWVHHFGSAKAVLLSPPEQLPKLPSKAKSLLRDYQHNQGNSQLMMKALHVMATIESHRASMITIEDDTYPAQLKQIYRPPPLLFTKGNLSLLKHPQIAVIGTRNPTHGGVENTRAFCRYLSNSGFTITSGLALGIDGTAHQAAIEGMGNTVAVMATGIDDIYPKRHSTLAENLIESGGLLVSEFFPATPPRAAHFPQRNRIISGLSMGVLVVEAAVKSGSLITANYATEQNREVFCIPGSIHNPQSKGCHKLIKEGALLVETAEDIIKHCHGQLCEFQQSKNPLQPSIQENIKEETQQNNKQVEEHQTAEAQAILKSMTYEPLSLDQIIETSQLSPAQVSANLVLLELRGLVRQSIWGYERVT